jgi:hypothetical protein
VFDPAAGGGPLVGAAVDRQARAFGVVNAAYHAQRTLRFSAALRRHQMGLGVLVGAAAGAGRGSRSESLRQPAAPGRHQLRPQPIRPCRPGPDGGRLIHPPEDRGLLRQLWQFRSYGRPHLRALSLGVGLRVCELLADLAQPWPQALVVDGLFADTGPHGPPALLAAVVGGSPRTLLVAAAVAVLVITLASGAFDHLGDRVMNGAGEKVTAAIRADAFANLQRLPMTYHDGARPATPG